MADLGTIRKRMLRERTVIINYDEALDQLCFFVEATKKKEWKGEK